jgi:hypothetical protein
MSPLEKIRQEVLALQVDNKPVNHWEGTKFKPYVKKMIELDKVLKILDTTNQMQDAYFFAYLDDAIKQMENRYQAERADVDWFNNNTPNVGISVDYKSYPPAPAGLDNLKKLRDQLKVQ